MRFSSPERSLPQVMEAILWCALFCCVVLLWLVVGIVRAELDYKRKLRSGQYTLEEHRERLEEINRDLR